MSKITIKNIEKCFGKTKVLNNINFEVAEGEVVSLLGPSGSGKTTILKVIAGLVKQDKGDILFGEKSLMKVPVDKRGIVIVFQEYLLFPHLNVEENIGFGLKVAKRPKEEIKNRVEQMLELVKLKNYNKKYPSELSGGQQQRIALARALAIEPKVLLLDEPFSSLDTELREEIRELTLEIQRKLNITTILVTHDKEEALMCSDKIAVMLDGEIKQFDTPEQLYKRPNCIEVANFFGNKNYIDGKIEANHFISNLITVKINKSDFEKAKLMVKQEDIEILPIGKTNLEGKIISSKFAGDKIYYTVLVQHYELKVTSQAKKVYRAGETVSINIKLENIIIFT